MCEQYADILKIVLVMILGVSTYLLSGGMSPPQNRRDHRTGETP